MNSLSAMVWALAVFAFVPATAAAREYQVQMKTSGAEGMMVFEPSFIRAEPGDTVRFLPTQPSHNAESIAEIMPAGTKPIKGAIDQAIVLNLTKPGLYGIKCLPHYGMGMVALIQVDKAKAPEIAAARAVKLPGIAAKRMASLLAKVK